MRRVVVTGMGIVSSIGNNVDEVVVSLREARPGIVFAPDYAQLGFRCQVHGAPTLDPEEAVDRRAMRFHGGGTAWNHVAMDLALESELSVFGGEDDAGLRFAQAGQHLVDIVADRGHDPEAGDHDSSH